MAEKPTFTLLVQYNKNTALKVMVDHDNNWKSLEPDNPSGRARMEFFLEQLKDIGERVRDRPTGIMNWWEARFAEAVLNSFKGSKMLSFTGESPQMRYPAKPGVTY